MESRKQKYQRYILTISEVMGYDVAMMVQADAPVLERLPRREVQFDGIAICAGASPPGRLRIAGPEQGALRSAQPARFGPDGRISRKRETKTQLSH